MKAHWMLRCVASGKTGKGQDTMHCLPFADICIGGLHSGGGSAKSANVKEVLASVHMSSCLEPFWNV